MKRIFSDWFFGTLKALPRTIDQRVKVLMETLLYKLKLSCGMTYFSMTSFATTAQSEEVSETAFPVVCV